MASRQAPFLGTPLSSPGYFQFRRLLAGEPQADKTCYLKGLLEFIQEQMKAPGNELWLQGHLGVKRRSVLWAEKGGGKELP